MTTAAFENDLKAAIRTIPDYPKPGIMFRDITTLLGDARAFRRAVDELVQPWAGGKIDKVAGIEARGFILGGAVAHQVSAGFVPIRKKGKLPFKRVSIGYSLEYGIDEMEMHEDAVLKGERVILVDDLVATGGTAEAACKLLKQIGANVLAACFIIDLPDLGGAEKIRKLGVPVRTLVSFEGHSGRVSVNSPCLLCPVSDRIPRCREVTRWAKGDIRSRTLRCHIPLSRRSSRSLH